MSFNSHNQAIRVETELRSVLNCERFGFGGIADADAIEYGKCYTAFAAALSLFYYSKNIPLIDDFLRANYDLEGIRIEDQEERFESVINQFVNLLDQVRT